MEKKNYYNLPYKAVKELLHTDTVQGLTEHEAMERLREYGYNEFKKREHTTLWQKFVAQFKSFMIIVLLIAAAISGVTGYMNGEGITDALIILVILVAKCHHRHGAGVEGGAVARRLGAHGRTAL